MDKCLNCGAQMYLISESSRSDASEHKSRVTEVGLELSWTAKRIETCTQYLETCTQYQCVSCGWWHQVTTREGEPDEVAQGEIPYERGPQWA